MDIKRISRFRYLHTMGWAVLLSGAIVISAAFLGRATMNLSAALTEKPDIALYLLRPDDEIGYSEVVRTVEDEEGNEIEKHYLADTAEGKMLYVLKRGEEEWYVAYEESMREENP